MPILKHGNIIVDDWQNLADNEALPEEGQIIVSLVRWRTERDQLINANRPLGLRITGEVDVSEIAADLDHFDLVAVSFPGIADGRGYSQARLLRQRFGFAGELRATGPLIRDVFAALERVGFDAIEARDQAEAKAWSVAVGRITARLQPDIKAPQVSSFQTAAE
jgi:uncharacterized protein (DUF934 family)